MELYCKSTSVTVGTKSLTQVVSDTLNVSTKTHSSVEINKYRKCHQPQKQIFKGSDCPNRAIYQSRQCWWSRSKQLLKRALGKLCERAIQIEFLAWTKGNAPNKKENWHGLQLEPTVGCISKPATMLPKMKGIHE